MILWFSGTGNSRYVAEQLALELGQALRQLTPDLRNGKLQLSTSDKTIIWVCPVYSWGLPPYVRSIMSSLQLEAEEASHYLVLTCGDDCGLAADMWRKEMRRRSWNALKAFSVIMPNNYVCMSGFNIDSKELEDKKLAAAPKRIREIATSISSGNSNDRTDDVVRGNFAWIKTHIIYPWFVRNAMSPKPFHSTSACISCGKCAAICPLHNIKMIANDRENASPHRRKRPVWGDDCAACLGCYHVCPLHAVMYGKATKNKGQYLFMNQANR